MVHLSVLHCTSHPFGPKASSSTTSSREMRVRMSMETGYLKCSAAGSDGGVLTSTTCISQPQYQQAYQG